MKAIFISDIHLLNVEDEKTKLVLGFLNNQCAGIDHLFILGDLFDVWPGTTDYLIQNYRPVLDVFRSLVSQGCKLHYIEGNHDFRLGEYFTENVGVNVHSDSFEMVFGNKKVFMSHGDLGNPKDKAYRVLRYLLRRDWLHFLIKPIPSKWIFLLGKKTSQASRGYQRQNPSTIEVVRQIYRETAKKLFHKGYDVVVMGHTHIPDEFSMDVQNRKCRYFNTGDWVKNFTYLEFKDGEFYTKKHPVIELRKNFGDYSDSRKTPL